MLELPLEDRIRLAGLGVRPDEPGGRAPWLERRRGRTEEEVIERLSRRLSEAQERERLAWREARRWRLWGSLALFCAAASVAAQLLAMAARRGGW
jgi:hypothetical protein